MNLDDMAREAMSRVSYAVAANAEWEKKKVAEGFVELRDASQPLAAHYHAEGVRSLQDLMMNASSFGLQAYAHQAASWNTSNLLNFMVGGYR